LDNVAAGVSGEGGGDGDDGTGSDLVGVVVVLDPDMNVHLQRRHRLEDVHHLREFVIIQLNKNNDSSIMI